MADTLNIFGTEYTGVTGIIATTPNETDLTYIRPQGTKNISTNGTGIDVAAYASVDVSVSAPAPTLQTITKSYTPTESQQTETITAGSGYDGIEEVDVTVGAISSSYVGTGITRRDSTDLSASGATVSVPSGYYASNASKAVASGSIGNPSWSNQKTTTQFNITASYPQFTEGYISSINNAIRTFTLQEETVTPSTTTQIIEPSTANSYLNKVTVEAMPSGAAGTPTATKGTVSNHQVSITPSVTNTSGYITGSTKTGTAVTVSASELVSGSETKTANGTYDVTNLAELVVNVSGGTSVQTKTGTFTGSNGVSVDISCNFAPDLIYVYGDLSGSTSNRGVISITIVKDTMILQTSDTSSSSANENASYYATSGVSGYVGSSSYCHATYSNSTLTIATGSNTSANRFTSGITYSYKLLKWTT